MWDFQGAFPTKQCSIFVVNTLIKQRFIICEYLHEPYTKGAIKCDKGFCANNDFRKDIFKK